MALRIKKFALQYSTIPPTNEIRNIAFGIDEADEADGHFSKHNLVGERIALRADLPNYSDLLVSAPLELSDVEIALLIANFLADDFVIRNIWFRQPIVLRYLFELSKCKRFISHKRVNYSLLDIDFVRQSGQHAVDLLSS